jgi:hypothetical protein
VAIAAKSAISRIIRPFVTRILKLNWHSFERYA